jgi:nicotinamide mononucleotide (NMN) deamidase PncC
MSWSDKLKEAGVNIHVAATGGGAGLQQSLWEVPGSSAYLSGTSFPYDQAEQEELLGFMPKQFCSKEAAINLASAAYMKAYKFGGKAPVGVGITASVTSEREHRGEHRVHCCIITDDKVLSSSFKMEKRPDLKAETTRKYDGSVCDELGFFSLLHALKIEHAYNITFTDATEIARSQFFEHPFFTMDGKRYAELSYVKDEGNPWGRPSPNKFGLMPGSFNPPHEGHFGTAEAFENQTGKRVIFEVTSDPPHKPALSVQDLLKRAKLLQGHDRIFTTNIPKFVEKAKAYPRVPLILGADTLLRILDPKWGIDPRDIIRQLITDQTNLYVSGREVDGKFMTRDDIVSGLEPKVTKGFDMRVFQELEGRWDISSTELRNKVK